MKAHKIMSMVAAIFTIGCVNELIYRGNLKTVFQDNTREFSEEVKIRELTKGGDVIGYKIMLQDNCILSCLMKKYVSDAKLFDVRLPACKLKLAEESYQILFTKIQIYFKDSSSWLDSNHKIEQRVMISTWGIAPTQSDSAEVISLEFVGALTYLEDGIFKKCLRERETEDCPDVRRAPRNCVQKKICEEYLNFSKPLPPDSRISIGLQCYRVD